MTRVLVTGARGHIGGATARHLFQQGYEVVTLSRSLAVGLPPEIKQHTIDISAATFEEETLAQILPCQAIVHAAAVIDAAPSSSDFIDTNCVGTQNVLRVAERWELQRFVFVSSVGAYGLPCGALMTEQSPLRPTNLYSASKIFGEHLTACATQIKTSRISLRVSSPVGPGLRRKTIFRNFVEQSITGKPLIVGGQGTRRQNYVDVRDVAAAIESALRFEGHRVFNIVGCEAISNFDLATRCVQTLGSSSPIELSEKPDPQEGRHWDISLEKAGQSIEYAPNFSIEDSIKAFAAELAD